MLNVNLQRRYPPGINHAIRVYLDPVLKPRQHLGASSHPNRRRVVVAHALLELRAKPRGVRGVLRNAGVQIGRRAALESVPANEFLLSRLLVDVAKSRDVKPRCFAVFINRIAARQYVKEAACADAAPMVYKIVPKHARRIAQSVWMLPRFRVKQYSR